MAAEHRRPPEAHPDPETLLAYHEGALPEAETDLVQEHLVDCPECAQAVLDFASFPSLEPPTEAHRLTPADVERRWRELQARLAAPRRAWWQRHEVLLPLAAAFFVAAVGLGVWGAGLRERVAELEGPRGDVQILAVLSPVTEVSRGAEEMVASRPPAPRQLIVLSLASGHELPSYRLDIEGPSGRFVVRDLELHREPGGTFLVELPRDDVAPGRYRLELFGVRQGARESLAEYALRVEP